MKLTNPFVIHGYKSPEYFCDRVEETQTLIQMFTQTGNVLLTAPRRIGKTGLIEYCFKQPEIQDNYLFHCKEFDYEQYRDIF